MNSDMIRKCIRCQRDARQIAAAKSRARTKAGWEWALESNVCFDCTTERDRTMVAAILDLRQASRDLALKLNQINSGLFALQEWAIYELNTLPHGELPAAGAPHTPAASPKPNSP